MPENLTSRALVTNRHERIIERFNALAARRSPWNSGAVGPATRLPDGTYLVVSPDESGAAAVAAISWAAVLSQELSVRPLIIDYAWEGDGLTNQVNAGLEVGFRDILFGATMSEDRAISCRYCDFLPVGCFDRGAPRSKEMQTLEHLKKLLRVTYRYVILISENPLRVPEVSAIGGKTDGVILVAELSRSERSRLEDAKTQFQKQGVPVRGALAWRRQDVFPAWMTKFV